MYASYPSGRPDLHRALDPFGEDHSLRQRSSELGRHREPVLRVEPVVEGAAERHERRASGCAVSRKGSSGRGGGVGGAPPPRSDIGVLPHFPPQRNPTCTFPPTNVHRRPPHCTVKRQKAGVSAVGNRGTRCDEPVQGGVRTGDLHASLPSAAASVRGVCLLWGAVGYPSTDLRPGLDRSPTMRGDEDHATARPHSVLALCAAIAAGCGSSSGSGGDDDPAALVPAGARAASRPCCAPTARSAPTSTAR